MNNNENKKKIKMKCIIDTITKSQHLYQVYMTAHGTAKKHEEEEEWRRSEQENIEKPNNDDRQIKRYVCYCFDYFFSSFSLSNFAYCLWVNHIKYV